MVGCGLVVRRNSALECGCGASHRFALDLGSRNHGINGKLDRRARQVSVFSFELPGLPQTRGEETQAKADRGFDRTRVASYFGPMPRVGARSKHVVSVQRFCGCQVANSSCLLTSWAGGKGIRIRGPTSYVRSFGVAFGG